MEEKINLAEKLALVNEYLSPAVVGRLNDYKIQVVKVKGAHAAAQPAELDERRAADSCVRIGIDHSTPIESNTNLAEGQGFEPWIGLHL